MITGRDVRKELKIAKEVIADPKTTPEQRMEALRKSVEVVAKVALGVRSSLVRVMEKLEVDKIKPSSPNTDTDGDDVEK